LASLKAQSFKHVEIIVIDRFSTDGTREIAQGMGAHVISHDAERSPAKNLGSKFANGQYLFFLDADHTLAPDSIALCIKAGEKVDGVLINDQDIAGDSAVSRLIASRRKILSHDSLNVAVRFVRKDVFDLLGGFDTDLYAGEDLDFHRRFLANGYRLASSRATEWHLGSPNDLRGLMNRTMYYSSNYLSYASKNPVISLKRLNPLRVVAAWKRNDNRSSDLISVVFLGFLSNIFLAVGIILKSDGIGRGPAGKGKRHNLSPKGTDASTPSKQHVIANYDREGKDYDSIRYGRTRGGAFFSEIELNTTLRLLKKGKVLHIGTATGRVSSFITSKGFDYVGLEISKVMARITKEKLNGAADIVRADAEYLPFKAGVFDNIISVRSFHFLPEPEVFLQDARRVLKRGGRVIVSFEKRIRGRETFRKMANLPPSKAARTYYTNKQVSQMMERAGLSSLQVGNVTKLPLLAYWRANNDRLLREIHSKMPYLFGTVGMVVGSNEQLIS